ncbi:MAG TPA: hypothetical protein VL523_06135 [Terriglobia bacterium]|nr:hypothetical protein [Terriglobia bacterium]
MSVLIDVGWRLYKGQRLYADFLCTLPVGFCLGAKYAFCLLGVEWSSQLYLAAAFAVVTYLWSYPLLSRLIASRLGAAATAVAIQCFVNLSVCYWWYGPITSMAATLFVLSSALWIRARQSWLAQLSWPLSLALLAAAKPNVAGLLIVGVIAVMFATNSVGRVRLLLVGAGTAALGVAALVALGISPFELMSSYAMARGRVAPHLELSIYAMGAVDKIIAVPALIGLGWPVAACLVRDLRRVRELSPEDRSFRAVLYVGAAVALWAMLTNAELKFVDMPMLAVAGVVLYSRGARAGEMGAGRSQGLAGLLAATLCWVALVALYLGAIRYRVEGIGYGEFYEPELAADAPGVRFFASMRTGPRFPRVVAEIKDALAQPGTGTVFFGPRMEWGYAAFNLASPEHLPLWWHRGSSYAVADEAEIFNRWRQQKFSTLIFLKDDLTCHPFYDFLPLVQGDYDRDDSFPNITVFRRVVR